MFVTIVDLKAGACISLFALDECEYPDSFTDTVLLNNPSVNRSNEHCSQDIQ